MKIGNGDEAIKRTSPRTVSSSREELCCILCPISKAQSRDWHNTGAQYIFVVWLNVYSRVKGKPSPSLAFHF